MHKLHTTSAIVLGSFTHGESNRVYKLLTRDFGLLYAHAQGVRELKSRNKYALKTGQFSEITLVKGKAWWRITGAQNIYDKNYEESDCINRRKILNLVARLLPVEDYSKDIFDILRAGDVAFSKHKTEKADLIEIITVLRLLDKLGFLSGHFGKNSVSCFLNDGEINVNLLEKVFENKKILLKEINNSLNEALQ